MACGSCGKSKVKYQVKVDGRNVGSPQPSVAEAHVLGKASTSGGQKYTMTAVKA